MRLSLPLVLISALLFGLLVPNGRLALAAGASAADKEAKASYGRGRKLSAEGHYAEALAAFSHGYELSHLPAFLFNMGECARALGDLERARDYYERFLAAESRGASADLARQRLAELPPAPVAPPVITESTPVVPVVPPPPVTEPGPRPPDLTVKPPAQIAASPALVPTEAAQKEHAAPVWKSPWLWVGVGVAIIAGSVAIYAATQGDRDVCPAGCVDAR
jgi:tetratricopeptide (TPR) repeat protein